MFVESSEGVQSVRIRAGQTGPASCDAADADGNGEVTMAELIVVVNNALGSAVHFPCTRSSSGR